jgi:hypothetical protein
MFHVYSAMRSPRSEGALERYPPSFLVSTARSALCLSQHAVAQLGRAALAAPRKLDDTDGDDLPLCRLVARNLQSLARVDQAQALP